MEPEQQTEQQPQSVQEVSSPNRQPRVSSTRPAPRGTASYQRKRAVRACQVCRARRTKCDNLKPSCSFCLKVGANCIQSPVDLSSFDPASLKILERLDDLEELMRASSLDMDNRPSKTRAVDREIPVTQSDPVVLSMVQPLTLDDAMSWSCFEGLFDQADGNSIVSTPEAAPSPDMILSSTDLDPMQVRNLTNNYFRYVHIKNPILNESATREILDSMALNGLNLSPQSCLSLLICALGAIATPFGAEGDSFPGSAAKAKANSYFLAAERRLGALLASFDIIAPRCLFLAGAFMMCNFEPVRGWRFFLQALAHCQQLKLTSSSAQQRFHESPGGNNNGLDYEDSEKDSLHQAVYWSSWKSERDMRRFLHLADFGGPDDSANLYPAFFPTPPPPTDHSHLPEDQNQEREDISWYFYLAEISLRRLSARLGAEIEGLYKIYSSSREFFLKNVALVVPSHETQLQEWIATLPPVLSFSAPAEEDDVCRFVLRGLAVAVLDRIYWQFLSAFLDGTVNSLDSAWLAPYTELAQKGLDHQQLKLTINRPGYRHRHQGTYAMIHSCARSALVLAAAAIQSRSSSTGPVRLLTMPHGWDHDVGEMIHLLDFWGQETRVFDRTLSVLQKAFSRAS